MEKIITPSKMSKINLNSLFFEIILSMKGSSFRARTASMTQITNIKDTRPEATSTSSYENAIQKLIPKIENSLKGTDKYLGKVFQAENGKIMYSVENVIYQNNQVSPSQDDSLSILTTTIVELLKKVSYSIPNINMQELSNTVINNINKSTEMKEQIIDDANVEIIKFTDVTIKWLKFLLERTKKDSDDADYLSPGTLEGYNRSVRDHIFPYLEEKKEYDNILTFTEQNVDEILNRTNSRDTKRILLLTMKLIFEFAKQNSYIKENPIANKKLKKKKKAKKDYEFIEEDKRAVWINCMLEDINSKELEDTDAPLAFLVTLLHGNRPEETCGTKWIDFNFKENDYHIQNAYKNIPIFDEITMKRIGWKKEDGPLKTPESDRHLSLDMLCRQLLLVHRIKQMYEYRKAGKKWSEKEYVFHNSAGTPFTPDILSKNFNKFIARHEELNKMVIYGLRHSFATHCRNLGMKPEVLARLMGHSEYETTQKYYIHISPKQKREALQSVQQQDIQQYLGEENKNLVHLQNKVSVYSKEVSNLQEVQNEDMTYYLHLNNQSLSVLKDLIEKINKNEKIAV